MESLEEKAWLEEVRAQSLVMGIWEGGEAFNYTVQFRGNSM